MVSNSRGQGFVHVHEMRSPYTQTDCLTPMHSYGWWCSQFEIRGRFFGRAAAAEEQTLPRCSWDRSRLRYC